MKKYEPSSDTVESIFLLKMRSLAETQITIKDLGLACVGIILFLLKNH